MRILEGFRMADDTTINRGGRPPKARGAPNSSDAADARWTVRGVSPNVRNMALKAAAGRGMTAGDWLSEAIVAFARGAAKNGVSSDNGNLPAVPLQDDLAKLVDTLRSAIADVKAQNERPIVVQVDTGRRFRSRRG